MGCTHRSAAVGGWAAGFPPGKWPSPSLSLFETLNRNRRQGAPGREAAPARISLPGGAAMTHPLPPSPAPLLEFLWPFYLVLYKFQECSATSFKQDEAVDT